MVPPPARPRSGASRPRTASDSGRARRTAEPARPTRARAGDPRDPRQRTGAPRPRPAGDPRRRAAGGDRHLRVAPKPRPPARRPPKRHLELGSPPRRLRVGFALMTLVLGVLGARRVQLQGLDSPAYAVQAEQQRLRPRVLPAARGEIVDRNGFRLATTIDARAIYADPKFVEDKRATALALAPVLNVDAATLQKRMERDSRFVYLARAQEVAVGRAVTDLDLPGVYAIREAKRSYPGHTLGATLVGYMNRDGAALGGIESAYDKVLRGTDGRVVTETDTAGRRIPAGEHTEVRPVAGRDVVLTIDRDLQWKAQHALATQVQAAGAKGGSVIVIEPTTGEILALATAPTFDAEDPGSSTAEARKNRAVADVFEPGSTNKVITAAAALETGTVTPDTVVVVPPGIRVANKTFTDAHPKGTQRMTFTGVIAKSSNVGTITVALRLGKERMYEYLRKFGLGERTGVGFPGESPGILSKPEDWWSTQIGTIPIGHGVSVTALQAANVYATVANDGVRLSPTLVRGVRTGDGELAPVDRPAGKRILSPRTAHQLRLMLEAATTDEGTGSAAQIPGYRIAGKTGTARKVQANGQYGGYFASFIGFAPADKPALVVLVQIDEPTRGYYGGSVAAPVFQDVMSFALRARAIPPTGTPPPPFRLMAP